jgi:5-methylcytosine-specific restriction endonuclease McrA
METLPYKNVSYPGEPPATSGSGVESEERSTSRFSRLEHPVNGELAQSVSASVLHTEGSGFEFRVPHHTSRQQRGVHRKEYMRNYGREWMRRRRAAFFDGKSCDKCGATSSLELHHRNPEEKIAHGIWSWAEPRRKAEIAKCVVLCESCHQALTSLYLSSSRPASLLPPGPSGISNVRWYAPGRKWRVSFEVEGKRVNVGGGGFRNIVTARLTAESFRASLAAHYAKRNVAAQISCRKQLSLPLPPPIQLLAPPPEVRA